MKKMSMKISSLVSMAFAGLLLLASCNSEDAETTSDAKSAAGNVVINLTSTFADHASTGGTRALVSSEVEGETYDKLDALWKAEDRVMLGCKSPFMMLTNIAPNSIAADGKTASFTLSVSSELVGKDLYLAYPSIVGTAESYLDYRIQDGTLENVSALDARLANFKLTQDAQGEVEASAIKLSPLFTAYFGIMCYDQNGDTLKVEKLSMSPLNDTERENWSTTVNALGKGGNSNDNIVVIPSTATKNRIYLAVPKVDNGVKVTFTARDAKGYLYTVSKKIPAEAGHYYPVSLEMTPIKEVDLGLSVNWSAWNYDATEPVESGFYDKYGVTDPYLLGSYDMPSTYQGTSETLSATNDIVAVKWENNWRMPTLDEFKELVEICKITRDNKKIWENNRWHDRYGLRITGPNGNSIFIPAAGYKKQKSGSTDTEVANQNYGINLWTSSCPSGISWEAASVYFGDVYPSYGVGDVTFIPNETDSRRSGYPIRPVRVKK